MEESLVVWANDLRSPALDPIVSFLTEWGIYTFPLALLAVFLHRRNTENGRSLRDGWLAFLLALFVSESILKPIVGRARPSSIEAVLAQLDVLGRVPASTGFPSGTGTACGAGATWILLRLGPRAGAIAWLFAVLVSFTRLYAGVHWPTDLLAGWIVGALTALGVDRFSRWAA